MRSKGMLTVIKIQLWKCEREWERNSSSAVQQLSVHNPTVRLEVKHDCIQDVITIWLIRNQNLIGSVSEPKRLKKWIAIERRDVDAPRQWKSNCPAIVSWFPLSWMKCKNNCDSFSELWFSVSNRTDVDFSCSLCGRLAKWIKRRNRRAARFVLENGKLKNRSATKGYKL